MKKLSLVFYVCILIAVATAPFRASTGVGRQPQDRVLANKPVNIEGGPDLTKKELANKSDLIVVGECVGARSAWINGGRTLVTLATVSVGETLKGGELQTVTVVLPGGIDAARKVPVAVNYVGAPTITPHEQMFLFLSRQTQVGGGYAITGSTQGKLTIEATDVKARMRAMNEPSLQGGDKVVRDRGRRVPLSKFKEEIKRYL